MVHVIKIYFQDQDNDKQIRRLAVNSDVVGKFDLLAHKIREIFPALANRSFSVTWKDSENDVIHMSSDEELAHALANAEEGLLRIYVYTSGGQPIKTEQIPRAMSSHNEMHPNVVCDSCDKNISGYRYKCLQCRNYDLCSACNAADKHGDHDMVKIVKPAYIPREWVFMGARKMWRSMFGRCPGYFHTASNFQQQKDDSSPETEKPKDEDKHQWQKVVNDLLKGDYVPAEKLLKDNLGTFLNFVDTFANVDVKVENCPFTTGPRQENQKPAKDSSRKKSFENISAQAGPSTSPYKENPSPTEKKDEPIVEKETTQTINSQPEIPVPAKTSENIKDVKLVDLDISSTDTNKVAETQFKEASPIQRGLFSEVETSMNADGWTLVHGEEAENKETGVSSLAVDNGAKPKANAIYPDISESVQSYEAPQEQLNACAASEQTQPKEAVIVTQDPEIINALVKMQQMGFTNEGGWLERLLVTKDGNINSALDALYPNARRQ